MNNERILDIIATAIGVLSLEGAHTTASKLDEVYEYLSKQFKEPDLEPHCSDHKRFEYDCLDCSDALERQREKYDY